MKNLIKIAVLDDYQQVAMQYGDWQPIATKAIVTVFTDHLAQQDLLVERLQSFQVLCVMRERTPLTKTLLSKPPPLRLVISTGLRNASIDMQATNEFNIKVIPTGYHCSGAPELAWAFLLAIARHLPQENDALRSGDWQLKVGADIAGKTIGIAGLGRVGKVIARYAAAFDMKIIAWSENLTAEKAAASEASLVTREQLFADADFISIHLMLSDRTRGLIAAADLQRMKPSAYLVDTSRGPIVDEQALIELLQKKATAGAALDVFNTEPLPQEHPFRQLENVLATPHIGYVTAATYRIFYRDIVKAIMTWLDQQ